MAQVSPVSGGGGGDSQGGGFQGSLDRARGNGGNTGNQPANPAMNALSKTLPEFLVNTLMRQQDINPIAKESIEEGKGSDE